MITDITEHNSCVIYRRRIRLDKVNVKIIIADTIYYGKEVVSIAIIKNLSRNLCDGSKHKNKKVVACRFEPSTRQRWYTDYSARPASATITKKFVMHY